MSPTHELQGVLWNNRNILHIHFCIGIDLKFVFFLLRVVNTVIICNDCNRHPLEYKNICIFFFFCFFTTGFTKWIPRNQHEKNSYSNFYANRFFTYFFFFFLFICVTKEINKTKCSTRASSVNQPLTDENRDKNYRKSRPR